MNIKWTPSKCSSLKNIKYNLSQFFLSWVNENCRLCFSVNFFFKFTYHNKYIPLHSVFKNVLLVYYCLLVLLVLYATLMAKIKLLWRINTKQYSIYPQKPIVQFCALKASPPLLYQRINITIYTRLSFRLFFQNDLRVCNLCPENTCKALITVFNP